MQRHTGRMDFSYVVWNGHKDVLFCLCLFFGTTARPKMKSRSNSKFSFAIDRKNKIFRVYKMIIEPPSLWGDRVWLTAESAGAQDRIWTNLKNMPSSVDFDVGKYKHGGKYLLITIIFTFLLITLFPLPFWSGPFSSHYSLCRCWCGNSLGGAVCLIDMDMNGFSFCFFSLNPWSLNSFPLTIN